MARQGGDEFLVLLTAIGSVAVAESVAARIMAMLQAPVDLHGQEVTVGSSVGIAISRPGIDSATLLQEAAAAMYRAKRSGKGCWFVFSLATDQEEAAIPLALGTPKQEADDFLKEVRAMGVS